MHNYSTRYAVTTHAPAGGRGVSSKLIFQHLQDLQDRCVRLLLRATFQPNNVRFLTRLFLRKLGVFSPPNDETAKTAERPLSPAQTFAQRLSANGNRSPFAGWVGPAQDTGCHRQNGESKIALLQKTAFSPRVSRSEARRLHPVRQATVSPGVGSSYGFGHHGMSSGPSSFTSQRATQSAEDGNGKESLLALHLIGEPADTGTESVCR